MNMWTILTTAVVSLIVTASAALAVPPVAAPKVPWGSITGHVRDSSGKPIANLPVIIVQTGETAETDKDGQYVFDREEPGTYSIRAFSTKYAPDVIPVTIQAGGTMNVDLTLKLSSSTYAGKLSKPFSGNPILHEYSGPRSHPTYADPLESFQGDSGLHATARSR